MDGGSAPDVFLEFAELFRLLGDAKETAAKDPLVEFFECACG
jgi:hypothetical protein